MLCSFSRASSVGRWWFWFLRADDHGHNGDDNCDGDDDQPETASVPKVRAIEDHFFLANIEMEGSCQAWIIANVLGELRFQEFTVPHHLVS